MARKANVKISAELTTIRQRARAALHLPLLLLLASIGTPGAAAQHDELLSSSWDEIVAQARGGEVNWYMWGGSDLINSYVSGWLGARLKEDYDITLNRIGINDTAEAVNAVLQEVEAGISDAGSVDMIWINGENFRTLRQAGQVFCGYKDLLPNTKYVDWSNPAIAFDFGTPVDDCETPWNRVQFAFGYDSARIAEPPADMAALLEWIKRNPGRFTYPAPPDFTGSAFVRHVFMHAAGDVGRLMGDFDQQVYAEVAARTWAILNEINPYLWREGATYPRDVTAQSQLFSNQEIDFHFSYDAARFGNGVEQGDYPVTTRSYGLASGTLGNTNYVAIPLNAANKAAALVLANLLISPEAQYQKSLPEVWGTYPAIEVGRLPAALQERFAAIPRHPSVVPAAELTQASLPEMRSGWVVQIEKDWQANVVK